MTLSRRKFLKSAATASLATGMAPALLSHGALAAEKPILIGSLHDQSGTMAASGEPMVASLNLAVDEINAAGGLIGRPLKLVHYDTQSSIQQYSQYAQQLALKDKVDVVIGGITSASREAIRPTFDRFKILYVYNTLYEGGVCDRNIFSTGTTPAQTVEKLVPFAIKSWGKKVYIIAADYNYGQITSKWMAKYVKDNGGEVLATDFFPLDVTNFGTTISKIQAAKPDLILSCLVGGNHTAFYRQWASAGMKGQIPVASTTFGLFNEAVTLDASETDGVVSTFGYFEELTTPKSKSYVEKLRAKYPSVPYISELAAATYEGFYLWTEGVKKAQSVDRMKVIEALETGVTFDGPSGKVSLDHATHHATRNTYLGRMKSRKWEIFETFENQKPLDTATVCDLIKNPADNQQYIIKI